MSRPRRFTPRADCQYIAFYKPFQVLCQFTQPPESNKVTLASFGLPPNVYPVGRLDWDSEGLLLLSDDGALNKALLDPLHGHLRVYLIQVENIPSQSAIEKLCRGVNLNDGPSAPAQARLLNDEPQLPAREPPIRNRQNIPTAWIELALTEGRNRQVRRMTAAIGHPTLRLSRAAIGSLQLAELNLRPGSWSKLTHLQVLSAFN